MYPASSESVSALEHRERSGQGMDSAAGLISDGGANRDANQALEHWERGLLEDHSDIALGRGTEKPRVLGGELGPQSQLAAG